MALTLVKETGTGVAGANSYADLADAAAYHEAHVAGASWAAASETQRTQVLVMATRLLDAAVLWSGVKAMRDNPLEWPRMYVSDPNGYDVASNHVPRAVVEATCELARRLLAEDTTVEPGTRGIRRLKVDSIEIEFDKTDRKTALPSYVKMQVISYADAFNGSSRAWAQAVRS